MKAAIAMQQIETAALTDKQYRAARRLLDRCATSGHLKLTKTLAQEVCTTQTLGATRRLLGQLKAAGVINYRVNGYVYVDFMAWCADGPRAESDHGRALSDHGRAESDHPRALSDHIEPATYTHAPAGVGWLVGITPSSEGDHQPTNPPITQAVIDPVEQAIAFGLLKSSGVMPLNAKRLAEQHTLAAIRRAVGQWWDNRNGQFRSPGIIVSWLDNPDGAGLPETSSLFERSPLYRQWRTQAEIAEEVRLTADLTPVSAVSDRGHAPATPLETAWAEVLATLAPELVAAWLAEAQLVELTTARARIVAPAAKVEYIRGRLDNRIRRALAIAGHRPEQIDIQEAGNGE